MNTRLKILKSKSYWTELLDSEKDPNKIADKIIQAIGEVEEMKPKVSFSLPSDDIFE
jgi:hypothetical protein